MKVLDLNTVCDPSECLFSRVTSPVVLKTVLPLAHLLHYA